MTNKSATTAQLANLADALTAFSGRVSDVEFFTRYLDHVQEKLDGGTTLSVIDTCATSMQTELNNREQTVESALNKVSGECGFSWDTGGRSVSAHITKYGAGNQGLFAGV